MGRLFSHFFAGVIALFATFPLLYVAGRRIAKIKLVTYGPLPEQAPWGLPTLIGSIIVFGGIVPWLPFLLPSKRIYPRKRLARNSKMHAA
jgi:hypothetical protein